MPRSVRQYLTEAPRDELGRILPSNALARFAAKCAFDPCTGCVMWIGTQTAGQGHSQPYGYFWYDGRMWLAHRWASIHIHGHEITGLQVDHCCPAGPSTLCVQHLKPEPADVNRALQASRPGRALQDLETRRHWIFVQKGLRELASIEREAPDVPFFQPPAWLLPFLPSVEVSDDCPF